MKLKGKNTKAIIEFFIYFITNFAGKSCLIFAAMFYLMNRITFYVCIIFLILSFILDEYSNYIRYEIKSDIKSELKSIDDNKDDKINI